MATKIKDSATAQKAALNLNQGIETVDNPGEPITPREKTTSEKLFPAFTTDDGGIVNRPVRPTELSGPLPVAATSDLTSQGQTPAVQPPTVPTYIKPEDLVGKMAKLKVDGVEQDVPAESLFKTNQLERHLNAQLMALAQERKQFEDERKRLQAQPQIPIEPTRPTKQPDPIKRTPEMEILEARYAEMQQQLATLQQTMLPAIQESGIKRVEQMAKERLGADDFRSYFERIRASAAEELSKPDVAANPQARQFFDSDAFYFQKYQEMKLKDLISKPSTPAPTNTNTPMLQTSEGAPVVISNSGKPVSIPNFESSGGVPSRTSPDASWQSTYNALFIRAQESGRQEDWQALYRHKIQPQA